ncbi:MAG: hypothetical protein IJS69_04260, partial [Selenomonadaceae bacterium]|nr:hypothetical protein [Selenomonadaceae bacterium]
ELTLTRMALGDGRHKIERGVPFMATDLAHQRASMIIFDLRRSFDVLTVRANYRSRDVIYDFFHTETGIFACGKIDDEVTDEVMLFYTAFDLDERGAFLKGYTANPPWDMILVRQVPLFLLEA